MAFPFEAITSGIGNVLNFLSQKEANKINKQAAEMSNYYQMLAAQNGIQWKVQDAIKAGVHPLVGLGAQTTSFSPTTVGAEGTKFDFSGVGQDLSRAFQAAQSGEVRKENDEAKMRKLQIEKGSLENDVLRNEVASGQIRNSRQGGQLGPPMPRIVPLPRPGPDRTINQQIPVSEDDIKQKGEDYPQTKIVRPWGYPLHANPWFSDGQQFEDRYGDSEVGSTIKFGVNTAADHIYTGYRYWKDHTSRPPRPSFGGRYRGRK